MAANITRSPGQALHQQREKVQRNTAQMYLGLMGGVQQGSGDLTQLLEGAVALQGQGQLLCSLVTDLVVSEVQLPQGAIGCQTPTEGGKGIFPRAKVVPL